VEERKRKGNINPLSSFLSYFVIHLTAIPYQLLMSTTKSGGKKRKIVERDRSKEFYDEEGDLDIISSDGVAFKLPAFQLQAAS
jgi:hypothetical protein